MRKRGKVPECKGIVFGIRNKVTALPPGHIKNKWFLRAKSLYLSGVVFDFQWCFGIQFSFSSPVPLFLAQKALTVQKWDSSCRIFLQQNPMIVKGLNHRVSSEKMQKDIKYLKMYINFLKVFEVIQLNDVFWLKNFYIFLQRFKTQMQPCPTSFFKRIYKFPII